ncbi:hypothetical protein BK640_12315 [Pseudomonas protegens]|nr:hypothetical protein A1395_10225 [Pseudomonas protegens]ROL84724.1 hypothetical protein BK639_29800 [Pseudomonas protegens]ROM00551.1 hypothetical protein BK641_21015 [Pseudomonas protegens]ROM03807.1 hypothetical protein BK640_12315 [Pseudomonas protegens]ROM09794.1 hypothetical protein BK642_11250 [Pseudomonas protegens]
MVLLDEPSKDLAPIIVQEIFQIVAQFNREAGVSFLIAEQRINLALNYVSHACLLDTGRVALSGTAEQLLARGDLQNFYLGKH